MQPSFYANETGLNDTTGLGRTNNDLTVLISDTTSRKARGVINRLNQENNQVRTDLFANNEVQNSGLFSRDATMNKSASTFKRVGESVLGIPGGGDVLNASQMKPGIANNTTMLGNSSVSMANLGTSRPGSAYRIKSA